MDAFEQYTDLVNAANAIVNDTDARYEAFAKAEGLYAGERAGQPHLLRHRMVSDPRQRVHQDQRHVRPLQLQVCQLGETSEDAYTTAQYEEFAKAFDAAIQG